MLLLAFAPWVEFTSMDVEPAVPIEFAETSIELRGTETSVFRDAETVNSDAIESEDGWCSCRVDFGDGYFVAFAGLLIVASAALAYVTRRDMFFGPLVAVAALGSLVLTGFNALADWQAIAWTESRATEAVEGSPTPYLWALVLVCAIAALCGAVLWGVGIGMAEPEDDEELEYEEEISERYHAWA
jgi:hypothetical protein